MKQNDPAMNSCPYCAQLTEQIRLTHAHVLNMYLQWYRKYRQFKGRITDEGTKTYFHLADRQFYDKTGKLCWSIISEMMPQGLEKNIRNKYSILTENEIRLCCLLLFDVYSSDIIQILPVSQKSVYSIAYRIRQKTGMKCIKTNLQGLLINIHP